MIRRFAILVALLIPAVLLGAWLLSEQLPVWTTPQPWWITPADAPAACAAVGTLTAYGYLMDIESADAQSNETYGLRFAGKQALGKTVSLLYTLEYARQEDYADNPVEYDADYYMVEAGLALPAAVTLNLGQEMLEGDEESRGKAFRTPLATLHKFQGWADVFLATPSGGIQDSYAGASIVVAGVTAQAVWHDF